MLSSGQRTVRVAHRRRKTLGWPIWLSLALHLTVFVSLLMIPPPPPTTSASGQPTVEMIMGEGPTTEPPAPLPDVPPAPTPTPAPDVPPPPSVQQAENPPPTPTPVPPPVQQPAPVPDVPPPPPIQQAEIPPPPPPVPKPVPSSPKVTQVQHPVSSRRAANAPVKPAGSPAHAQAAGQNGASDATNAAWMAKLKQWWDEHAFYPKEASQTNEGGNVKVHIVIAPDGRITSIEVVQGSGLRELDAAAVAVFRDAHLPPLPSGTPAQPADVVVTLHYRPV